jgi:hypothetical protein
MRSIAPLVVLLAVGLGDSACLPTPNNSDTGNDTPVSAEKPFIAGGQIEMHLDGGGYEIRAAADDRIHLTTSGHTGNAKVEITTDDKNANVKVTDTPHNNFHAVIDVPKTADLVIRLTGGELTVASIAGNKDVESYAGNVAIDVGNANDYSTVDASVKAGDLNAAAFGGSKSGLLQHFTWSGPGKHKLRANLGAGNLVLRNN